MKLFICLSILFTFNLHALEGLKVGDDVPNIILQDTEGQEINLNKLKKTTALVFYRGSWCPYCIKQLVSIQNEVMGELPKNSQLIAISVDKLQVAKKMKNKNKFSFAVVSDPKAKSLKAFNIVNQLNDELVKKYKSSYQIDVEADSGEKHHMVAHPAVFVVKSGKISFADVHINYKDRTKNSSIITALK